VAKLDSIKDNHHGRNWLPALVLVVAIVLVLAVQLVAQQAAGKIAEWTAKSPSKTGKTLSNHRHNVVDNDALVHAVAQ
jgi:hypothetical protein